MTGRLPLCADVSRALGEDPAGTAPHWKELTVLELDLPVWAQLRDQDRWTARQSDVFARLGARVEAEGAGFGVLKSAPVQAGAALRVRHYAPGGSGFVRRDFVSDRPQSDWASGIEATLLDRAQLRDWQEVPPPAGGADVHVCTNGAVDAACGRYGVPVFAALQAAGLRAWRTAHFGGHRFAATAIELPTGLAWAHLTPDLAVRVARREVTPAEVRGHLRGHVGLPKRAQVLDRELLVQRGWAWLEADRRAVVEGEQVTLEYEWRGVPGVVRARVVESDALPVPSSSHRPERNEVRPYRLEWVRE